MLPKTLYRFIVISTITHFFITGCGEKAVSTSENIRIEGQEKFSQANNNDPQVVTKLFKEKIESDISKMSQGIKEVKTHHTGESFSGRYKGNYSYDIKKTDSIVSPFIGKVDYQVEWHRENGYVGDDVLKITYTYHDGQWKFKDGVRCSPKLIDYNIEPCNYESNSLGNQSWIKQLFK